jgi:catecholate siderophore receptor
MGLTAAAAFGAPAAAQDGREAVDTVRPITVTGRRAENETASPKSTSTLLNTPQTIAVIPQAVFEAQGARNLTDVLMNTPGITFNAGENGFATGLGNFSLRGFDTSGHIFVDGARDSGSYNRDAFNTEQVEVVKGPSADNGRGSAGGYVNLVTKTPHLGRSASGAVSYGFDDYESDGRVRATLDLNEQLSSTAAARINLLIEDGGVPTRDISGRSAYGIAPSVSVGLGTPTRLTVALQHLVQEDAPDYGIPAAAVPGLPGHDASLDGESLRDVFYGLSSDFDDVRSNVVLARIEHAVSPDLEISTQLRWSSTDRFAAFTMPSGYAAGTQLVTTLRQAYKRDNEALSLLGNLSANATTGALRHRIAAGIELSSEEADARAFATETNPGTGAPVPLASPNPGRAGAFAGLPTELSTVEVRTLAAYLHDTIELSPHWQLTGGLRAEQYEVDIRSRTLAGAPTSADGLEVSETTLGGRLGLVFKPTANSTLYASAGTATLPPASFLSTTDISRGGANGFPGFSAGMNSADSKVQRSVNYEIGGKWDLLDRNLVATAALFRTERRNVAITGRPTVTDPVERLGYGEQIVQGIELGLSGRITPQWSVFAGALLLESERRHDAALDLGRCRANPADYGAANAAACDATHVTSGDALAFTPEVSANLWTTYDFDFGLTVGGGVRYVGESYIGRPDDAERIIPNRDARILPDYWVANAIVEYDVRPDISLRLNVDNITDEFHAVSTNWGASRVTLGAGRSYLLTLRYRR